MDCFYAYAKTIKYYVYLAFFYKAADLISSN